jgi:hypothetical protein
MKTALISAAATALLVLVVGGAYLFISSSGDIIQPTAAPAEPTPAQSAGQSSAPIGPSPQAAPTTAATPPANAPVENIGTDKIDIYELQQYAYDSAYDEESGRLIVASKNTNQVALYDTLDVAKPITVEATVASPTTVAAKRHKGQLQFLAAGETDPRIDLFDGDTGQLSSSVSLAEANVTTLSADPRDDNPYAYYSSRNDQPVGRIDVEKKVDEPKLQITGGGVHVSADGWLYLLYQAGYLRRYNTSLSDFSDSPGSSRDNISGLTLQTDANGAYLAIDKTVLSSDCRSQLGEFEFVVSAFIPNSPWALGAKSNEIWVSSINDYRVVAKVPLPVDFFQSRDRVGDPSGRRSDSSIKPSDPSPLDFQTYVDAKRQRLLVVSGNKLAVIPLAMFNLPTEPTLALEIRGPVTSEVYKPLEYTIRKVDPSVEVRTILLPEGATYENDTLKWTPGGDKVGAHEFKLEARQGKFRREYVIDLLVSRSSMSLPFYARSVALSRDAAKALVWGHETPDPSSGGYDRDRPFLNLAVIDVASRKVIATRKFNRPIYRACIDENGAYIVLSNSEPGFPVEVHRLSLDDLSVAKTATTEKHLENSDSQLHIIGGKFLSIGNERFSLPDLNRLPQLASTDDERLRNWRNYYFAAQDLGDMVSWNGIIWNEALQPILLINPPYFISSDFDNRPEFSSQRVQYKWGRTGSSRSLEDGTGKNLLESSDSALGPLVLWQFPAACRLDISSEPKLLLHELVEGKVVETIGLDPGERLQNVDYFSNVFECAGSLIVACAGGRLTFVSLDEIDRAPFKAPFRVSLKQDMVLKNESNTNVTYELLDGKPPYQLKLTIGDAKFSATNAPDGVVAIKTDELVEKLNQHAASSLTGLVGRDENPTERVLSYIQFVAPLFEQITGRKPQGVPVVVPATLEVTDGDLQIARLAHAYLVELPRARVIRDVDSHVELYQRPRLVTEEPRVRARTSTPKRDRAETALPREERETLLREMAADYASVLRKRYPPADVLTEQVDDAAKVALVEIDAGVTAAVDRRKEDLRGGLRTWSDKKGHTTSAVLREVFADQVVLASAKGTQVTVPIDKLSQKDQDFIKQFQEGSATTRPDESVPAQMEYVLRGINGHYGRSRRYPPAYLASDDGQPLLSWRVLILPYIGGEKLFKLFRLDEPWDSPHNRQLLKYRPAMFGVIDSKAPETHTTILATRGQNAILADATPVSVSDITDPRDSVFLIAEVKSDRAIEWTRPDDLDGQAINEIKDWLNARDGKAYVGFSNMTVRAIPADTPPEEWQKGINASDGAEANVGDEASATKSGASAARAGASNRVAARSRRRNEPKPQQLEQIKPGQFILANEEPTPGLIGEPVKRPDGLTLRALAFTPAHEARIDRCIASPDGVGFGLTERSLVRFNIKTGRIEKQAKLNSGVASIHWCAEKLLLVRGAADVFEFQLPSGEWQRAVDNRAPAGAEVRETSKMEVWVVDPTTLKSLRGYLVPGDRISCATNKARLLTMHGFTSLDRIDLVDLKLGMVLDTIPRPEPPVQNESNNNGPRIDFEEVAMLPDGESALALGRKLYRIEFPGGQIEIAAESPELQNRGSPGDFGTSKLYISSDGEFAAFRHGKFGRALHRGAGYLVFQSGEVSVPFGGVPANDDREQLFAMDVDRKLAFVGSVYPNTLTVYQGKEVQRYTDMPQETNRIASVPGHDALFLFDPNRVVLLTIPGKSDEWSFGPQSKKLTMKRSTLRSEEPQEPLTFVENPERKGALMLESYDFDAAAFSGDGEWLYVADAKDNPDVPEIHSSTIHAFDTHDWRERRRIELPNRSVYELKVSKAGPMVFHEKACDILDAKTLNVVRTIEFDDYADGLVVPGSKCIAMLNEHRDIQLFDLKSGDLALEILHEQIVEWDGPSEESSDEPQTHVVSWSRAGDVMAIRRRNLHFVRVSGDKPEYICKTGVSSEFDRNADTTAISPHGKYASYLGTSGELKMFELPNVANAVGQIQMKEKPYVIDDEGRQYGAREDNTRLVVVDLAGNEVYRDPKEGVAEGFNYILLHPTKPNIFASDIGGLEQIIDIKK